jgi:hypothetical protein
MTMWHRLLLWWCYSEESDINKLLLPFSLCLRKKDDNNESSFLLWCYNEEGDNKKLSLPSSLCLRKKWWQHIVILFCDGVVEKKKATSASVVALFYGSIVKKKTMAISFRWRTPKSWGETHLRVSQSQVAESWDLEARSRLPTLKRGRGSSWEPRD